MQERQHYSKAPITEAIIDLRGILPSDITLSNLHGLTSYLECDYPYRENAVRVESQVTAGASVGASANQTQVGYVYSSDDGKQILNAGLMGFTFSRLAPYDRWETFRDEARRLWEIYCQMVRVEKLNRIAVRYINRIDIPLPFDDFKIFLRTVPEVSPELPQGLSGYFMQLQIPQPDIAAMAVINQAMMPPQIPNSNSISVILDIDIFQDQVMFSTDTFWTSLELLHTKLDTVFEACITDQTRELIK
jgi:uncharacterized protein (TIGR04255 family)